MHHSKIPEAMYIGGVFSTDSIHYYSRSTPLAQWWQWDPGAMSP